MAGFASMTAQQQSEVLKLLQADYGFDLAVVLEQQRLELWQREHSIYALPERLLRQFADFPCIAIGMLIGEWINAVFVPSHELIARFSAQFTGRRWTLTDQQVTQWLTGLDLRNIGALPYPTGSVILLEDERHRYLGRGKVLLDRLRNLLPKR